MPAAARKRERFDHRLEPRRTAFLAAARHMFLARGYGGTTLDDIIARSGGSRATLYAEFGGKEGLFAALISDLCKTIVASLEGAHLTGDIVTALRGFGFAYTRVLMTPEGLGLYRILISESARFPELGRSVFAAGPQAAADRLAAFLRERMAIGELALSDADLAARHFLEMVKGDLHLRCLLGIDRPPNLAAVRQCVSAAVEVFLGGARAGRMLGSART